MLFVNCHTENYLSIAERLIESLDSFGLDYETEVYEDQGSWVANCLYKAEFIQKMHQKYGRIVWVDADAVVKKDPALFKTLTCDVAFHKFKSKELLSGTLFFNDTEPAEQLISYWVSKNKEKPNEWDQKNLQEAISHFQDLEITILPPEYCFIFDLSKNHYGNLDAVIEHHQASRRFR